ncbi:MAG: hypothetical protein QY322_02905 [bacterium]|nr:MAG: hypothetical protein QY322_02905 [bacterium]
MKKEQRNKLILKRKNFLPTLVLIFVLLFSIAGLIYFTDPSPFLIFLFFVLFFAFSFFVFALLLANTKRAILISTIFTIFLLLIFYGVGNILNLLLLIGIGVVVEIYARFKK